MQPFVPHMATTRSIAVSSSSQSLLISDFPSVRNVRVYNDGTATVWIEFTKASGYAVTAGNGVPVPAGSVEVFTTSISDGPTYVSVIAAGTTGTIYFTSGRGI